MDELDKLIESAVSNNSPKFNFGSAELLEIVSQIFESQSTTSDLSAADDPSKMSKISEESSNLPFKVSDSSGGDTIEIPVPKFQISMNWGSPEHANAEVIEMLADSIPGSGVSQKLKSLDGFITDCKKRCISEKSVPEILSSLVFLETFASIISDFESAAGGYLFEGFLASLLGGKRRGGTSEIADLEDASGKPLSLKLLFNNSTKGVVGSVKNLDKSGGMMTYVIGIKERSGGSINRIRFYMGDIFTGNGPDGDISTRRYPKSTKYRDDFSRFEIPVSHIRSDFSLIADLAFGSKKDLAKIAQNYADSLGENLINVYTQISNLSNNVNKYFLTNEPKWALQSKSNANELKKETDNF